MLENLPEEEKTKIPVYNGEFLLTAHGVGSYTSRTVTKRWNKRCELLADAAERFSSAAVINGLSEYPQYTIDEAWKKVLAHHFHDDITGTSFEKCYKRSHNDYIQALNTFSSEYTSACKRLSAELDTSFVQGTPVIVSNPVQTSSSRKQAVTVRIKSDAEYFSVFDKDGAQIPSQSKAVNAEEKEVTFLTDVASCSLTVYDLREAENECSISTQLSINENCIENKNLTVKIDDNGDICSIFDKRLSMELLKKPVRLCVLSNVHSFDWPAWEIKYEDLCAKPYMYASNPVIKIKDSGSALCSLEIIRSAGKSSFSQIISLDCESEYVSVYNETDWREEASLLKAEFCTAVENDNAYYDIGTGFIKRPTNTKSLYEVPAQKWADITDKNGAFGVSVFSDSRTGWDKPDGSTLRLSLIHTPLANYRWECSQHVMDMGLNRYSFAVMGHKGTPENVSVSADMFCQPMHTFITDKHTGTLGKEFTLVKLNNDKVRITCIKKAQESDEIIFRVCACSENDLNGIEAIFNSPVMQAIEVLGDETKLGEIPLTDGRLCFDMKSNEIKSFALSFSTKKTEKLKADAIELKYNAVGITSDTNRTHSTLRNGISLPGEITPDSFLSAGIRYKLSKENKNCLVCDGSYIDIPDGYKKIHLLLTSLGGDKTVKFTSEENVTEVSVPDCFEALGHWDFMQSHETGYIKSVPQALTLSHTHSKNGNMIAKQLYLFSVEIPLNGKNRIKLPDDSDIVIFAASAEKNCADFSKGDLHFDTLEKRKFNYEFSDYAKKRMNPNRLERVLNRFIDSTFTLPVKAGEFYNKYAINEIYFILRNLSNKLFYKKNVQKLTKNR